MLGRATFGIAHEVSEAALALERSALPGRDRGLLAMVSAAAVNVLALVAGAEPDLGGRGFERRIALAQFRRAHEEAHTLLRLLSASSANEGSRSPTAARLMVRAEELAALLAAVALESNRLAGQRQSAS